MKEGDRTKKGIEHSLCVDICNVFGVYVRRFRRQTWKPCAYP